MSKNVNKLQSEELVRLFREKDIILFTESWLGEEANVQVNGFQHFQLNRTVKKRGAKRESGGIIAYIRDELVTDNTLFLRDCDDILWLKFDGSLFNSTNDLFLCLSYNVPEGSSRQGMLDNINLFDRLSDQMVNIKTLTDDRCMFLVCGDFNARTSDNPDYVEGDTATHIHVLPEDYTTDTPLRRLSEDKGFNRYGSELLDFCKQTGLRIFNGRAGNDGNIGKCTYVGSSGKSLVDYVIGSQQLFPLIDTFVTDEPNIISDHCIVNFSLHANIINQDNNVEGEIKSCTHKYVWNNEHISTYQNALESDFVKNELHNLKSELLSVETEDLLNSNLTLFQNTLESVCTPLFKKTLGKNNCFSNTESKQPWYNENCKLKRNIFYDCLSKFRLNKEDIKSREAMVQARAEYKRVLRQSRYEHRKSKTQKLEKARFENAKDYWKLLKNLCTNNSPKKLTSQHFAEYFKAINNPDSRFFQADDDILFYNERYVKGELQIMFQELDTEISVSEIIKGVKSLKNGKSSGPDLFLNEFIKYGINNLIEYLYVLFNKIFDTGFFPDAWGEGYIVPLHKKGSVDNVENYRGITLLSVIGKLFTNILNSRLNEWAENYHVYVEAQAGFRKGMGTMDNIFVLHSLISHCVNNNKKLYSAFVDFKKAFDYVVRDVLWYKLIQSGIRGKTLNIIQSMYKNIKSRVKFNDTLSEDFSSYVGVRQGECLSPFLFSMYINDLEQELIQNGIDGIDIGMLKLYLLLYADDIVIFSMSSEGLQKGLDVLSEYCNRWKLTVNTDKTKVMIFRKGGNLARNLVFSFQDSTIEIVNKFVYLGITFSTGGSFNETHKTLSGQALKAIFKLNQYLYNFTNISTKHILDLFDKLIVPI
ncbi:MAG: reverse transcriptase domain-containing protein, partial [Candidatus Thiodiazotropha endolucinida]|nr:endonuclease/exonuclease/phosphatase family protein [Candidatus Thiodiazotropha taylori]MCW4342459.1 reverse transcriptase domain-containing protein [Candidatus Thiodiazotropha endolucinida]